MTTYRRWKFRAEMWWLGLNDLDRASVVCSAVLGFSALLFLAFLLGVI